MHSELSSARGVALGVDIGGTSVKASLMRDLTSVLVQRGAILGNWSLERAVGVSGDGATIVGAGRNPFGEPEGWVAMFPSPTHLCVDDVDDGSGTGRPDGGVGIADLLYYLLIFNEGAACADVDDGSGTGTIDGGVGIEDFIYFLTRYEIGC